MTEKKEFRKLTAEYLVETFNKAEVEKALGKKKLRGLLRAEQAKGRPKIRAKKSPLATQNPS